MINDCWPATASLSLTAGRGPPYFLVACVNFPHFSRCGKQELSQRGVGSVANCVTVLNWSIPISHLCLCVTDTNKKND